MCDEKTEQEIENYQSAGGVINRRDFTKLTAVGALGAAFPQFANADSIEEHSVNISTKDGIVDGYFYHAKKGSFPAVLMWPDIKGLRPAFQVMARRLAMVGYSVLVVNPFYRDLKGSALPEGMSFPSEEAFGILRPMRRKLTPQAVKSDTAAFFEFLSSQKSVDTSKKWGVQGYCMSGSFAMHAAADFPDRVGAIASFHGGGLATDDEDSPHLRIEKGQASVLHAIAENDDEKDPKAKDLLREAYSTAGINAEIEVYEGAMHGWCPPDSRVYNEVQAEKAWASLLNLYESAL